MAKRIKKLFLRKFRGATTETDFDFDEHKALTLIYGENGCGKSTVVDALDFVCNGKLGSLEDRSIGSANKWDYLKSSNDSSTDLQVSIEYGGKVYSGKLGKREATLCSTTERPRAHILRKTQILRIIDAQPADRYKEIQALVEIPELVGGENSLREAHKKVTGDLNESVRARTQAEETLHNTWRAEGEPDGNFLVWAEKLTAQDITAKTFEVQEIAKVLIPFDELGGHLVSLQDAEKDATAKKENCNKDSQALKKMEGEVAANGSQLVSLLQDANQYIGKATQLESCPICESPIASTQLLVRLKERLAELKQISQLVANKSASEKSYADALAVVRSQETKLIQSGERLLIAVSATSAVEISSLSLVLKDYEPLLTTKRNDEISSNELPTLARSLLTAVTDACQNLLARKTSLSKAVQQHNAVHASLLTLKEKRTAAEQSIETVKTLADMLAVFERHRKEYVNKLLESISNTVETLFQELHPGEELGKAKFYLNPNKKGSLEYHGQFLGKAEVQPQAYYSDSHLDTLGICVFLALGKCYNDGNMVIVLDDVISSVDQIHSDRFMDVVHKYASEFQHVIMTTHFRPLKDRYLYARGPAANVQIIELLPWTIERGIVHTKTKVKAERLENLLASQILDRESAASQAGILLESLLDFITLQYQCKMPRSSDPSYTLARLIQGIDKKLADALKTTKTNGTATETALKQILDPISGLNWIRNQVGCHFSLKGMSISDSEVREFANLTIQLSSALICSNCGELPRKPKSGSDWECTCGQTHLVPLVMPGVSPNVG